MALFHQFLKGQESHESPPIASPLAGRFAYSDEFITEIESTAKRDMAKSKTKRRVSLAASIGKKLLGSSKTTVEEEQSEPSEAGSPTTEAPACALSMELRGHASVNVQKLTAMQVQLQALRRELASTKAAAGGLPAEALRLLQPLFDQHAGMRKEYDALHSRFDLESTQRRQLYNRLMEYQGNIRVFCRCRPMLTRETDEGVGTAVEFNPLNHMEFTHTVDDKKKSTFLFDRVYQPTASQADVFADCAPVVTSILDGYNVCILAYGQTGTGKTHTIWGQEQPAELRGVNFRTLEALFADAGARAKETQYSFYVSMLEVYNDQLRDLVYEPAPPLRRGDPMVRPKLEVRQARGEEGYEVHGLEEVGPLSMDSGMDEVMAIFRRGNANRATAATAMNTDSSRSHSLLRVRVRSRNTLTGEQRAAKLWLVDLAGSERLSRSEATGDRMKEAQHINKSLSALGDCIQALCARQDHVPYRNSKLTQVLQDSLGGEAKTLMYVQVSPSQLDAAETLCTLNFANRARATDLGIKGTKDTSANLSKMKQDVAAARASNKEAQSEAARLRTELGEALRQLADRETAMEWMEVEQEKELSALRRQAAAAAATVEAQTREIAELKAAQEAAWSEAALASAKAEAAEAAATAATSAAAAAVIQTPAVKIANPAAGGAAHGARTAASPIAQTPMCAMMTSMNIMQSPHEPLTTSELHLASPERVGASPTQTKSNRQPLASLNHHNDAAAALLCHPDKQPDGSGRQPTRGILRQSLPNGLNKTRLSSLQPVPAAATPSAKAGLRSHTVRRSSLPGGATSSSGPVKREGHTHPLSPDGKRSRRSLTSTAPGGLLSRLESNLPKRPSTAVARFASAAKGSVNKARKSITGSLSGLSAKDKLKERAARRSSSGWSHSYK